MSRSMGEFYWRPDAEPPETVSSSSWINGAGRELLKRERGSDRRALVFAVLAVAAALREREKP